MFVVILLPLGAASGDTGFLQALRNTDYHHVESATVGRGFHTFVMLPDSYAGQEERSYPTIYVLDGGALFPLLASYYRYLSQGDEIEEAIIVGISYGSADYRNGNHRSTDFTAPSAEREYWGGAVKFQQFLETELLPFVESKYRSRTDRRVLFGHSLGGQFVLYSAQTNPGLFWGRIASNPALHRNLEFFLETVPDSQSDARLFVGAASQDEDRFRQPWLQWLERWSSRERLPWDFKSVDLDGHGHMSSVPVAFRQGMIWLLSKD